MPRTTFGPSTRSQSSCNSPIGCCFRPGDTRPPGAGTSCAGEGGGQRTFSIAIAVAFLGRPRAAPINLSGPPQFRSCGSIRAIFRVSRWNRERLRLKVGGLQRHSPQLSTRAPCQSRSRASTIAVRAPKISWPRALTSNVTVSGRVSGDLTVPRRRCLLSDILQSSAPAHHVRQTDRTGPETVDRPPPLAGNLAHDNE